MKQMPKSTMNQVNRKMVKPAVKPAIRPSFNNLRSMFRSQQRPMAQPVQPQMSQAPTTSPNDQVKLSPSTQAQPQPTQIKQEPAQQPLQQLAPSPIPEAVPQTAPIQQPQTIGPAQQAAQDQNRLIQQAPAAPANPAPNFAEVAKKALQQTNAGQNKFGMAMPKPALPMQNMNNPQQANQSQPSKSPEDEINKKLRNKTFGASGF